MTVSTCVEWLCARAKPCVEHRVCVCACVRVCVRVCVLCACVRPVWTAAARRAGVCVCPATQARNDWNVRERRTDTDEDHVCGRHVRVRVRLCVDRISVAMRDGRRGVNADRRETTRETLVRLCIHVLCDCARVGLGAVIYSSCMTELIRSA